MKKMYYLVHTNIEQPFRDFHHSVEIVMKSPNIKLLREVLQEKYQLAVELEEELGEEDFYWMCHYDPKTDNDHLDYMTFEDGETNREIYDIIPDSKIELVE